MLTGKLPNSVDTSIFRQVMCISYLLLHASPAQPKRKKNDWPRCTWRSLGGAAVGLHNTLSPSGHGLLQQLNRGQNSKLYNTLSMNKQRNVTVSLYETNKEHMHSHVYHLSTCVPVWLFCNIYAYDFFFLWMYKSQKDQINHYYIIWVRVVFIF